MVTLEVTKTRCAMLKTDLIQTDGSTHAKIADVSVEEIYVWFLLQRQEDKHINNVDILKQGYMC